MLLRISRGIRRERTGSGVQPTTVSDGILDQIFTEIAV